MHINIFRMLCVEQSQPDKHNWFLKTGMIYQRLYKYVRRTKSVKLHLVDMTKLGLVQVKIFLYKSKLYFMAFYKHTKQNISCWLGTTYNICSSCNDAIHVILLQTIYTPKEKKAQSRTVQGILFVLHKCINALKCEGNEGARVMTVCTLNYHIRLTHLPTCV